MPFIDALAALNSTAVARGSMEINRHNSATGTCSGDISRYCSNCIVNCESTGRSLCRSTIARARSGMPSASLVLRSRIPKPTRTIVASSVAASTTVTAPADFASIGPDSELRLRRMAGTRINVDRTFLMTSSPLKNPSNSLSNTSRSNSRPLNKLRSASALSRASASTPASWKRVANGAACDRSRRKIATTRFSAVSPSAETWGTPVEATGPAVVDWVACVLIESIRKWPGRVG